MLWLPWFTAVGQSQIFLVLFHLSYLRQQLETERNRKLAMITSLLMSLMLRSYLSLCCNNAKKLPPFITLQCYKITSLYIYSSNHLWHISSLKSRLLHDILKQTHAVGNTDLKIQAKVREIHTGLNVLPKYSLQNRMNICRNPCILTLN